MPALNFLNRNKSNTQSASHNADYGAAKASAMHAPLLHLPSEESRRFLRDRVVTAAAAVYIRHGVNTSLDLDEDPDLSKEAKVKKRQEQYAAHQAYKDRLQDVLGSQRLLPVISTCLLLDPKAEGSPSISTALMLSVHDAFACVALLLCNYVLLTASNPRDDSPLSVRGYDARIRNVLRIASIELLADALEQEDHEGRLLNKLKEKTQPRPKVVLDTAESIELEGSNSLESPLPHLQETDDQNSRSMKDRILDDKTTAEESGCDENTSPVVDNLYRKFASRKFQALEQSLADLMMSRMINNTTTQKRCNSKKVEAEEDDGDAGRFSRKSLVRAAKIGGVGIVAGTLFAVTGGLAAPGIAAGLAALGIGGTALTLAASPAALIALFGVGGGGLSAYKMKRRTDGLSEFTIDQEGVDQSTTDTVTGSEAFNTTAHLSTTLCISGWLNDEHDFQRPWGVTPKNLTRLERLQRFFSIVDPERVDEAKEMLKPYSKGGRENDTKKDEELWAAFTQALKEHYGTNPDQLLPLADCAICLSSEETATLLEIFDAILQPDTSLRKHQLSKNTSKIKASTMPVPVLADEIGDSDFKGQSSKEQTIAIFRVWDYQTEYGGDLYTVRWESAMLLNMCQIANNMVKEFANQATKEMLKKTALATIMAAVAWPSLLLSLAGSLDSDWTLITIRSDLAGVELARSLLLSNERRPVNLIGFSFGARIIYVCLLELNRHQALWEQQLEDKKKGEFKKKTDMESIEYNREPASIVQDVMMMGAPLFVSRSKLRLARHMVAGRFVNCYSRKDWILSLMFQYKNTSGILRGTCGTGPVEGISGIENFDVSNLISSWHANYCRMVPDILDMVGFNQPMSAKIS